jgi:hypothetical protein
MSSIEDNWTWTYGGRHQLNVIETKDMAYALMNPERKNKLVLCGKSQVSPKIYRFHPQAAFQLIMARDGKQYIPIDDENFLKQTIYVFMLSRRMKNVPYSPELVLALLQFIGTSFASHDLYRRVSYIVVHSELLCIMNNFVEYNELNYIIHQGYTYIQRIANDNKEAIMEWSRDNKRTTDAKMAALQRKLETLSKASVKTTKHLDDLVGITGKVWEQQKDLKRSAVTDHAKLEATSEQVNELQLIVMVDRLFPLVHYDKYNKILRQDGNEIGIAEPWKDSMNAILQNRNTPPVSVPQSIDEIWEWPVCYRGIFTGSHDFDPTARQHLHSLEPETLYNDTAFMSASTNRDNALGYAPSDPNFSDSIYRVFFKIYHQTGCPVADLMGMDNATVLERLGLDKDKIANLVLFPCKMNFRIFSRKVEDDCIYYTLVEDLSATS